MQKILLVSIVWLVIGLLAACNASDAPTATTAPPPTLIAISPPTRAVTGAPTLAATSAAPTLAQFAKGDVNKGKDLFGMSCSACHGPEGRGVKGLGKDMTSSQFIAGKSDDELLAFIKIGRPIGDPLNTTGVLMPPKGGNPALTDQQLRNIIAFIRTINQRSN